MSGVYGGLVADAAALAVLGLPVERFLTTRDNDERLVLGVVARRAMKLLDDLQKNQATLIANAFVKARLRG